ASILISLQLSEYLWIGLFQAACVSTAFATVSPLGENRRIVLETEIRRATRADTDLTHVVSVAVKVVVEWTEGLQVSRPVNVDNIHLRPSGLMVMASTRQRTTCLFRDALVLADRPTSAASINQRIRDVANDVRAGQLEPVGINADRLR